MINQARRLKESKVVSVSKYIKEQDNNNLTRQETTNAVPRAIQLINFTRSLDKW